MELHLLAYGPFTDRRLDLSAGEEGLHLILGRNEAGKSSALRALKALLYGIPERTQDDFIHATSKLRVGGRLRHASGRELYCYRRKGHRNTLLDADGRPLPDETMQDFLYGVDAAQFERRFGLDYDALVRGGESLLDEHGREAEALFGSALGRAHLKNVLDRLDREAAELFVPRGQKPLINAQLNQLADLKRRLRDVSLSAHRWDESRQTLDRLKGELAEIESRLTAATARRQTLERLRRTLPALARRARLREQLDALADAPWLPPDLGARYQQAEQRRRLLREQQRMARARLAELTRKADAEPLAESLLAQGEAIDRLRERLGSHRKAAQDRPHLVAAARVQAEQAAQRLALIRPGLGLEAVASLSPLLKHRRLATELGEHREALDQAVATATAQLAETERLLAEARATLDALPAERLDLEELERAIQASRRDGDLDQAIAETTARLHLHLKRGAQDLAALGLWSGDLTDLLGLPLPSEETVRRFGSEIQTLDDAHRRLLEQRNQTAAECHRLKQVLRTLQLTGPVPSEDDLRQARHHRDRGWQLIRRQWLTAEDLADESAAYASGLPLPEAFEQAMAAADALADRLRCEMQRVHDYATTQAALETQQRALAELEAELNALSTRRCHIESDWETLWAPCGLKPLPPREMLDWLGRVRRIQDKAVIADELRQTLDLQYAARARHLQALSRLLNGP
ncbi:MAG: AAA family ATPase, partial [Thermochromatium sp.]